MQELRDVLTRARARARQLGRPVLASWSEPIVAMDPIDVLLDDPDGPQMFWASADRAFAAAGIGAACTIEPVGAQRFADGGAAAARLYADAIIEPAPMRPLLMGGFAFDATGAANAWRGFGASSLVVPRLLVRRRGEDCVVTLSARVSYDTDIEETAADLEALQERVIVPDVPERPPLAIQTTVEDTVPGEEWRRLVTSAVAAIQAGRLEKVVVAREELAPIPDVDVRAALRQLHDSNPGAFIYGIWRAGRVLIGASPELLVRVHGREMATSVLAGSTRRGASAAEDSTLGQALTASLKDREEHTIVRRELEAALSAVCDTVQVSARPDLMTLSHVQHLHTAVRGRLREGRTAFDVMERLHPTPAVGGAPREAALAFIRNHEGIDRGWYAGPVGWCDDSHAEFAVALRCVLIGGGTARLYAGCGIVAQSDPVAEWEESQLKLRPALEALSVGVIQAQSAAGELR